ncbi:MAG: L-fucose mutarotase [Planctomycetota bacterium]
MLKNISPLVSPDLLATLARMGHGDELVLADAHFPGHSLGVPTLRADGLNITDLLDAVLPLIVLDQYVDEPLVMMDVVEGDQLDPAVEADYRVAIDQHAGAETRIGRIDRFAFYDRARTAFAVLMTGETRKYGNIIVKKGVVDAS